MLVTKHNVKNYNMKFHGPGRLSNGGMQRFFQCSETQIPFVPCVDSSRTLVILNYVTYISMDQSLLLEMPLTLANVESHNQPCDREGDGGSWGSWKVCWDASEWRHSVPQGPRECWLDKAQWEIHSKEPREKKHLLLILT